MYKNDNLPRSSGTFKNKCLILGKFSLKLRVVKTHANMCKTLTFEEGPGLSCLSGGEDGLHEYSHVPFRGVTTADDAETQGLLARSFFEHNSVQRHRRRGTGCCQEPGARRW